MWKTFCNEIPKPKYPYVKKSFFSFDKVEIHSTIRACSSILMSYISANYVKYFRRDREITLKVRIWTRLYLVRLSWNSRTHKSQWWKYQVSNFNLVCPIDYEKTWEIKNVCLWNRLSFSFISPEVFHMSQWNLKLDTCTCYSYVHCNCCLNVLI
jgi:hypothetical protein